MLGVLGTLVLLQADPSWEEDRDPSAAIAHLAPRHGPACCRVLPGDPAR